MSKIRYNFYNRDEVKLAHKEKRNAEIAFSLTGNVGTVKRIIQKNKLYEDYMYTE